jgi:hypothetical protein
MSRIRMIGMAAVCALAIGVPGCSTGGGGSQANAAAEPADPGVGVQLEVTNEQRIEADIWVYLDGQRRRVGSVRSFSEDTFLIRMDRARNARLEFRLFGGPTCVTRDLSLLPGDEISYTIPMNITLMDAVCRGDS